jgi:Secretion system C-terminal sorting domain/PKD domain
MKKFLSVAIICFFLINSASSQEYVQLMEDKTSSFYDVQQAFNNYWDGKSYEKGKGWKQFKRWEYFMEPRVNNQGIIANPSLPWTEHLKFKTKYALQKGNPNNKAANWSPIGPTSWNSIGWNPGIGRVNAVAVDPNNSNIIYVGTPAGGCWKTINNGTSWSPLTDDFSSLGVSGIAIDPNNSNTIYLATGDGDGNDTYSIGVMKSTDGGSTWNSTGLNWSTSQSRVMRKIITHPINGNILWVATSTGIFKTTDAGVNWSSVLTGSFRDIELNPSNPNTVYACTNTAFYKSTGSGNAGTYSATATGLPTGNIGRYSIAVTADDANYVYLLATNSSDNGFLGLYRSTDGGASFTLRANSPNIMGWNTTGSDSGGQGWYDLALAVSPTNRNEIYTGGVNVWKSTNGGSNFNALTKWSWPTGGFGYVHADIHTLDFIGNALFCGSDGGIFKSTNNGSSWSDITSGIQNSQFYRLGTSATNAGIVIAGAQDNGCTMLDNGSWTHVTGGDGMECAVDYTNPNIIYSTSQNGTIYKSTNGGSSFNQISGGISDNGAWVTPYVLDPNTPSTIYAGYTDVWKSTNGGGNWTNISNFGSTTLRSLAVAPSNSNTIYAATYSTIKKTTNGGGNWTDITSGLPNNSITYITVHNLNPNILWVSLSGFDNGQKVYKSTNGGSSWMNVSGNLPNLPINCVLYEYGTNNGIYVGTDIGIYYKNDDLLNWQSYMTGLPNVMVNELEIHYASGKIRAATFGRGVWESDVFTVTTPPTVQFSTPDTNICPGNCATFTNQTVNLGQQWQWYFPGGTPSTSTDLNPVVCYPSTGSFNVSLIASNPNGADSVYTSSYVNVQAPTNGTSLPLVEGFETGTPTPQDWTIINSDNGVTWEHTAVVGAYGTSSSSVFIDNNSTNFSGEKDYLVSPTYDFSSNIAPTLTFDVAHAPYWTNRSDTLSVFYSNDCGVTKILLYEKDGATLATAPNFPPFFIPDPNEWRNESINLNALIGLNSVQLFFENKSDNGNAIYLDNINIIDNPLSIESIKNKTLEIYPNPFNNIIIIGGNNYIGEVNIINSIGSIVFSKTVNSSQKIKLNVSYLPAGMYLIKVNSEDRSFLKKILKN